jgi:hypothetical protein
MGTIKNLIFTMTVDYKKRLLKENDDVYCRSLKATIEPASYAASYSMWLTKVIVKPYNSSTSGYIICLRIVMV